MEMEQRTPAKMNKTRTGVDVFISRTSTETSRSKNKENNGYRNYKQTNKCSRLFVDKPPWRLWRLNCKVCCKGKPSEVCIGNQFCVLVLRFADAHEVMVCSGSSHDPTKCTSWRFIVNHQGRQDMEWSVLSYFCTFTDLRTSRKDRKYSSFK